MTAFAFAPGVLKTTIPFSVQELTGMLFTPAPALEIAFRFSVRWLESSLVLLTNIPSGLEVSSFKLQEVPSNFSNPILAMLLKGLTVNFFISYGVLGSKEAYH